MTRHAGAQATLSRGSFAGLVKRGPITPVCVAEQPCDEPAKGVTLLNYSNLLDTNVFVVTQATAARYSLVNVSDLAKPAP